MRALSVFILLVLYGCSTLPELQTSPTLNTTVESQSYYYCTHCKEVSQLEKQVANALEPDEPLIESKQVIESSPLILERSIKPSKKTKLKRKIKHKQQCIRWSKK